MFVGFSWLATLLINKNIPHIILTKAFKDEEGTVRASSLKCLQEMVKLDQLWEFIQENSSFYVSHFQLLYVRKDFTFIKCINKNGKIYCYRGYFELFWKISAAVKDIRIIRNCRNFNSSRNTGYYN